MYHCTPVELVQVPLPTILRHLTMLQVEAELRTTAAGGLTRAA